MNPNTFGKIFKVTSFGESHGVALGAVIDGCPAGIKFDQTLLEKWLERRRPGQSKVVSARNEQDAPEVLSGIFEGKTIGTPIAVIVRNQDAKPGDYDQIKTAPRAGHADDVWREKFGVSDHRGGGRASGRETLTRVIGAAFAEMFLREVEPALSVKGFPRSVGPINILDGDIDFSQASHLSEVKKSEMDQFLLQAKSEGQSYGGVGEIWIESAPANLGQPIFHKLKSDLAFAMLSIGATVGFELGDGFSAARAKGSEFHSANNEVKLETQRLGGDQYGGIRGGISTGEKISFKVAFKPTSSILDVAKKGRHDPCILLRAIPVLEAMTYLVLADHVLWRRLDKVK